MHPNPIFRTADAARNLAFARDRGFGMLSLNATGGPLVSHIPFALSDDGGLVELHLLRSNPILRLLDTPQEAVIAVQGPDSYISPDWYGVADQVPTWNYIAVHLRGRLEKRPHQDLHAMLDRLSDHFESKLAPKPAWTTTKMTPGVMEKMMRAIVPCCFLVSGVDGTWKLGQNKPDEARLGAAKALSDAKIGADTDTLSDLMSNPPA